MGFMRIDASLAAAEQDTFIAGTVRSGSRGPQVALRRSPSPRNSLWALQGLNLRLPPCEGGTLPLS
jgi:hypothetical protein